MNKNPREKFDLEERLIEFAVHIIELAVSLRHSRAATNLANQLARSGTSPALNYGEAQSAESRNDFIHKLKVVLKELRETAISLKIIKRVGFEISEQLLQACPDESRELTAIFAKSLLTAESRRLSR